MRRSQLLPVTVMAGLLLLGGCSSDTSDGPEASATTPPATPTAAPTTATPTPTPTAAASTVIEYGDYDDEGITLTAAADVKNLTGAPDDFKAFIAAELAKDQATTDEACSEKPQIYVSKLDAGGWAAGGHFIPQCGGYATLWAKPGGTWKEVWGGQELVDCATLTKYAFPAAIAGSTCLANGGEVPYKP